MSLLLALREFYFDALDFDHSIRYFQKGETIPSVPLMSEPNKTFYPKKRSVKNNHQCHWSKSLKRLRSDFERLQKEVRREINRVRPEEITEGLESQLFWIEKLLFYFGTGLNQIEASLLLYEQAIANNNGEENEVDLKHHWKTLQQQLSQIDRLCR